MKTKIILTSIGAGLIYIGGAHALISGLQPVDCVDCTDGYGNCESYGIGCCEPCQFGGGLITGCDESLCSGSTTTDMGNGCDKIETNGCGERECETTTTARCQKGYYGAAALNALYTSCSGCAGCPSSGGESGTTSGPGATTITECYLPSGTAFSDSTGSGDYGGNCYYKN